MPDAITIRGARTHNLKDLDLTIPRDKLVVITGLSGSGKSSLAFDTIFAEGQRRYVESLSSYARQFLGQLDRPDVDLIDGLSPTIAIDQKGASHNPRSTVGTITEVYDFLRLLFARIGQPHCVICGRPLARQTVQQIVDAILALPAGSRLLLLAPLVRERAGEHRELLADIGRQGFVRARIDGEVRDLSEPIAIDASRRHTIEAVVDRLVVRAAEQPGADHPDRIRVSDSVETALRLGGGALTVQTVGGDDVTFSQQYACPVHGPANLAALEPRDFSFNSPTGSCQTCGGLGAVREPDPDLVLPDRGLTLARGAVAPWARAAKGQRRYYEDLLASLAEHLGLAAETPLSAFSAEQLAALLYGTGGEPIRQRYRAKSEERVIEQPFDGVIPMLRRRLADGDDTERADLEPYLTERTCPACRGARLRPEILAVTVAAATIAQVAAQTIPGALAWAETVAAPARAEAGQPISRAAAIAAPILREIRSRLQFLLDVGLGYLTLDRAANTLSGGEAQRIRLATQIGANLSGVIYILDEPSIGLHPRDTARLLGTIAGLRRSGNTVILVEHDEETIRMADWIIDIGPGAGERGGELLAEGPLDAIVAAPRSITGDYLAGRRGVRVPAVRRGGNGQTLLIKGARANNLRGIDVRLPLGTLIAVTGVSGSGKSSLVTDTLAPRLANALNGARRTPGQHDAIYGIEHLDKLIEIDQTPLGRTPRSNAATYTKVFDPIRQLFAQVNEAKARGYDASRFSFNVAGGRCEHCSGEGQMQIAMQFLPDLYVTCEVCGGTRYNRETLDIRYRGKTIADVLAMTADEGAAFFERVPQIFEKLQALIDVGVGYIRLGQSATTLSGGEAQRIKLAAELARRATGRTMYILDEPTTGLHFADVERLLDVLQRLVDAGNTVVTIEHNLDIIKSADYIIDIGPEAGVGGGALVVAGTPEHVAAVAESHTGRYLLPLL